LLFQLWTVDWLLREKTKNLTVSLNRTLAEQVRGGCGAIDELAGGGRVRVSEVQQQTILN
jgi:hypothetical protein